MTHPAPETPAPQEEAQKGRSYLSKSRFAAIVALLETSSEAHSFPPGAVRDMVAGIRDIMQFDPAAPTYSASNRKWGAKWRQHKQAETGKSLYEIEGRRAAYARTHPPNPPNPRI